MLQPGGPFVSPESDMQLAEAVPMRTCLCGAWRARLPEDQAHSVCRSGSASTGSGSAATTTPQSDCKCGQAQVNRVRRRELKHQLRTG